MSKEQVSTRLTIVWVLVLVAIVIGLTYLLPENTNSEEGRTLSTEEWAEIKEHYNLGFAYDYQGDKENASYHFLEAIKRLPEGDSRIFTAYIYLARMAFPPDQHLSQEDEAELKVYMRKLDELKETDTDQAWIDVLWAEYYHSKGNRDEAIKLARNAVKLNSSSATFVHALAEVMIEGHNDGKHFFYTDNLPEVMYLLELSLNMEKGQSHSYYLLGVAYWFNGEKQKARLTWEQGLKILDVDLYPKWFTNQTEKEIRELLANPEKLNEMRL